MASGDINLLNISYLYAEKIYLSDCYAVDAFADSYSANYHIKFGRSRVAKRLLSELRCRLCMSPRVHAMPQ